MNTGSDRYNTDLWDATGSTFGSTGSVTIPLNASGLTAVQGWIASSATNYGLTIQYVGTGTTSDYWIVASSENTTVANRPKLNVTYCTAGPNITTTGTLTAFSSLVGVPSAVQTYTVAGTSLTDPIILTAPTGFQISTDGTNYYTTLNLAPTGGTVVSTTIYVRLYSTTEGSYNGNITHTSIGATPVDVPASGTVSLCTTATLTAAEDTYLSAANVTYNNGGNVELHVDVTTGTARRTALKWDVSSIPTNATVSSASLALYVINTSPYQYSLYNMRRTWVEGISSQAASSTSANWNTYDGANSWGTVGAANTSTDRYNTNLWSATTTSFSTTGSKTETLNSDGVAVVQGWIAGSVSNFGLIMQNYSGTTNDAVYFASSENSTVANRPKLNLSYCIPPLGPNITTSGTLSPFTSLPGVPSDAQTYAVAGSMLTADIVITAPTGFQLSTDGTNYYSTLTLVQTGGTVPNTTVYVRLYNTTERLQW